MKSVILPLDSEDRANVLIIDDSMFERNRSKKVELLAKVYDHAKHKYRFGFRMLTYGLRCNRHGQENTKDVLSLQWRRYVSNFHLQQEQKETRKMLETNINMNYGFFPIFLL